jgi:hypothetical protein
VSTRYSFNRSSIHAFERKFKVGVNLNPDQENELETTGQTKLLKTQLSELLDDLCPTEEAIGRFIEDASKELAPISCTLFVINDGTWKLMKQKPDFPDKMLPMCTIPWFYWDAHQESKGNPRGIQRDESGTTALSIDRNREEIILTGPGGDFRGIVAAEIDRGWAQGRSIVIPGGLGSKKKVVSYKDELIRITLKSAGIASELYPEPEARFDYGFSESPKVFYEHGIKISTEGSNAKLRVGNGRESSLAGEVVILLGKSSSTVSWSEEVLLLHVLLKALDRWSD